MGYIVKVSNNSYEHFLLLGNHVKSGLTQISTGAVVQEKLKVLFFLSYLNLLKSSKHPVHYFPSLFKVSSLTANAFNEPFCLLLSLGDTQ